MGHTALHTVGAGFATYCGRLTTVVLPDTVTKVGSFMFLSLCGRVGVTSGSTAVQLAAAEHNAIVDRAGPPERHKGDVDAA